MHLLQFSAKITRLGHFRSFVHVTAFYIYSCQKWIRWTKFGKMFQVTVDSLCNPILKQHFTISYASSEHYSFCPSFQAQFLSLHCYLFGLEIMPSGTKCCTLIKNCLFWDFVDTAHQKNNLTMGVVLAEFLCYEKWYLHHAITFKQS